MHQIKKKNYFTGSFFLDVNLSLLFFYSLIYNGVKGKQVVLFF